MSFTSPVTVRQGGVCRSAGGRVACPGLHPLQQDLIPNVHIRCPRLPPETPGRALVTSPEDGWCGPSFIPHVTLFRCLGVCGTGPLSSGGADSRAHVSLKRVQGGSVLFHVTRELEGDTEAQLEEMAWGFGPETTYRVLLRVVSGGNLPTWVSLQDKYRHRVRVPNMRSLLIENLTREDSGQYRARGSFTGGREFTQVFQLTVYEPVPLPQILAKSVSITADWCNVTLECRAVGASEDLNVTWRHSDLPRKWQQAGTLGPGPSVWPLAVHLPLDQANTSLTCNASNQVDLKTATTTLGEVCAHHPQGQATRHHLLGIVVAVMSVLLTVGVGLYLWKTRGKKKEEMETGTGAGLEEGRRDHEDDIHYIELSQQEPKEGGDKGVRGQHLEGKRPVTTLYSEVHRPGPAMKVN